MIEIVKNVIPEYKDAKEREIKLQNVYNVIQRNLSRQRANSSKKDNKK